MIIKHGCAILRPMEEKDFDLLYFMINDPEIEYLAGGWNYPVGMEQQKEFMRTFHNNENHIKLMIELTNGKTIGMVTADCLDWKNRTAHRGIKIHASAEDRIRGDMKDASWGFANYLFNELGFNCLYSEILVGNTFALKGSKKPPNKVEGVLRQRIFKAGKYHDVYSVSLLREDFNMFYHIFN